MKTITSTNLPADAAKELTNALKGSEPVLLLLSGGSALSMLDYLDETPENLTVSVLDERYSAEEINTNFAAITKTPLYTELERGISFFDTIPQGDESLEALAKRFDAFLHDWRQENPKGRIIATMGIGADGHTAGIFPREDLSAFQGDAWAVSYEGAPEPHTQRLTVTFTFLLEQVDFALVYVAGEEKKAALEAAIDPKAKLNKTPAAIIQQMRQVVLVTDLQL